MYHTADLLKFADRIKNDSYQNRMSPGDSILGNPSCEPLVEAELHQIVALLDSLTVDRNLEELRLAEAAIYDLFLCETALPTVGRFGFLDIYEYLGLLTETLADGEDPSESAMLIDYRRTLLPTTAEDGKPRHQHE